MPILNRITNHRLEILKSRLRLPNRQDFCSLSLLSKQYNQLSIYMEPSLVFFFSGIVKLILFKAYGSEHIDICKNVCHYVKMTLASPEIGYCRRPKGSWNQHREVGSHTLKQYFLKYVNSEKWCYTQPSGRFII